MSLTLYRAQRKAATNNPANPNKTICTLSVCEAMGVGNATRYLHCFEDVVYALRTKYTVRSRLSQIKGKSLGGARKKLKEISEKLISEGKKVYGYFIAIPQHAVLLNAEGQTIIDTAPRKRDARKVIKAYVIYK